MSAAAVLGLLPALALVGIWLSMRGELACQYLEPNCQLEPVFGLGSMLGLQLAALPVMGAALVFLANARGLTKPLGDIHSEERLTKEET